MIPDPRFSSSRTQPTRGITSAFCFTFLKLYSYFVLCRAQKSFTALSFLLPISAVGVVGTLGTNLPQASRVANSCKSCLVENVACDLGFSDPRVYRIKSIKCGLEFFLLHREAVILFELKHKEFFDQPNYLKCSEWLEIWAAKNRNDVWVKISFPRELTPWINGLFHV